MHALTVSRRLRPAIITAFGWDVTLAPMQWPAFAGGGQIGPVLIAAGSHVASPTLVRASLPTISFTTIASTAVVPGPTVGGSGGVVLAPGSIAAASAVNAPELVVIGQSPLRPALIASMSAVGTLSISAAAPAPIGTTLIASGATIGVASVAAASPAAVAPIAIGSTASVGEPGVEVESGAAAVPNVWLDSDLGPDTDDRDTFLLMADAHKRGVVNLVGVSSSTIEGSSGAGLREFCKFAGVTPAPLVGVNKDQNDRSSTSFFQQMRQRFAADETTNDNTDAGYIALRKGLASVTGKLTILTIGGADNIADLLQSPADSISPLTGLELVAAKCDRYISMLGDYDPATGSGSGPEYNVQLNIPAAQYVADNWPASVPLDWIGTIWGDVIHVAPDGKNRGDDWRNAAAMAFMPGPNKSYDLGNFYEVTGQAAALGWTEKAATNGKMSVSSSGVLSWSTTENRGHSYYRWQAGVDRSETGSVAAKINADMLALCPVSTFQVPPPLVDMNFLTGTYSGASLSDIICNGAEGRTAQNADGSTVTFGANALRITDQGLFLDGNGSDTMRFAGALLAAFARSSERSVLIITNKTSNGGDNSRLLGASQGYVLAGGVNEASSWNGSFGGQGNFPAVSVPTGSSWANRVKTLLSWDATSRRIFLAGASTEIVGKGLGDLTNVYLGHNSGGGERWNGFVERIIVYDKAMPFVNGTTLTAP